MTSKLSNENYQEPTFKIGTHYPSKSEQKYNLHPNASKTSKAALTMFTAEDFLSDIKTENSEKEISSRKTVVLKNEAELAAWNEAASKGAEEQKAKIAADTKFRSYEELLSKISLNHSKKLVEDKDQSIQIQDHNKNFLNRILRNF
ncbi:MAG: hypothetical protein HWD61_07570 [Parachlamydiaceae bacterium]|nr:MAG: hypothetical protein HWD61_07570 [Parachlamydiaceae bacterium]